MLVNFPDITPPQSADKLGIALSGNEDQCHVGIVYRPEGDDEPYLLHLAWHHKLRNDRFALERRYVWVDLQLDDINKFVVAQYCKHIFINNPDRKIPYGFNMEGKFFDRSGHWIGEEGAGLTCATFVLAVFREMSLPLLKTEEWRPREADKKWHDKVLEDLKASGASAEHLEKQHKNKGGARFYPTEVAGSASSIETPVGFNDAVDYAEFILSKLCEYNKRVGIS